LVNTFFDVANAFFNKFNKVHFPPSFRDGGAWEQGNAHGGCVGAPLNFREIHRGRGDIGVPISNIINNKNSNDKIPTITIHPVTP
jgi:hypothetical protein